MASSKDKNLEPDGIAPVTRRPCPISGPGSGPSLVPPPFQNTGAAFCIGSGRSLTACVEGRATQPPNGFHLEIEGEATLPAPTRNPLLPQHGTDAQRSAQSHGANGLVSDDPGHCTAPESRPQSPISRSTRATYATSQRGTCSEASVQWSVLSPATVECCTSECGDAGNAVKDEDTTTTRPPQATQDSHTYGPAYAGLGTQFGLREQATAIMYELSLEFDVDVDGDGH
jgi:hypothetical protein